MNLRAVLGGPRYRVAVQEMSDVRSINLTLDHRGMPYATDRVGTGLFILEYTSNKPLQTTATNKGIEQ